MTPTEAEDLSGRGHRKQWLGTLMTLRDGQAITLNTFFDLYRVDLLFLHAL